MTNPRDILAKREILRGELQSIQEAHPDGNVPDELRTAVTPLRLRLRD